MDPAELEARGLYDPHAPNAADRLALLEYFADQGLTLDEMVAANARGRLAPALSDRLLHGGDQLIRIEEVAAQTSVSLDLLRRAWRAMGFPAVPDDVPVFSRADVEVFGATFQTAIALFGEDVVLQFIRVLGSSLARIADAAVAMFLLNLEAPLLRRQASELEFAQVNATAMGALMEVPRVIDPIFRHHVAAAIQRAAIARGDVGVFETVTMAVGFVDLVESTAMAQSLEVKELARVVAEFEAAASDVVALNGARVVKLIGDEVMYVSLDAAAACDIALSLCEFVDAHPVLPNARGAVATGKLITRDGDYYGPHVNLAARATKLAQPGGVLATAEVKERALAAEGLYFRPVGPQVLRGFDDDVELFAVSRA